jgi:hypothetical protein
VSWLSLDHHKRRERQQGQQTATSVCAVERPELIQDRSQVNQLNAGYLDRRVIITTTNDCLGWLAVHSVAKLLERTQIPSINVLKQLVCESVNLKLAVLALRRTPLKRSHDCGVPDLGLGCVLIPEWCAH